MKNLTSFNSSPMETSVANVNRMVSKIDSVKNGSASHEDACECAMYFVGNMMSVFNLSATIAVNDGFCSKDLEVALQLFDDARSFARASATFFDSYPFCKKIICDAIVTSGYAESVLIVLPANKTIGSVDRTKTYIVKHPSSSLIKIGKSVNPVSRIKSLSTGAGCDLDVLSIIDGDMESALHNKFSSLRVFGEWFKDDGSIFEFVKNQMLEVSQ